MKKILITAGSSFSDCNAPWIDTWPRHLEKHLNIESIHLGQPGVGNAYISRAVIHTVIELLKTHKAEDLILAIMWTHWDRIDLRIENLDIVDYVDKDLSIQYHTVRGPDWPSQPVAWKDLGKEIQQEIESNYPNLKNLLQNPYDIIKRGFAGENNWTEVSQLLDYQLYRDSYFTLFEDVISKQIYSIEHILRTQWFLQQHGVAHVAMKNCNSVLEYEKNNQIDALLSCMDTDCFIDAEGLEEWTFKNFGKQGFPSFPDRHPGTQQHLAFTQQEIVPYMETKCLA